MGKLNSINGDEMNKSGICNSHGNGDDHSNGYDHDCGGSMAT